MTMTSKVVKRLPLDVAAIPATRPPGNLFRDPPLTDTSNDTGFDDTESDLDASFFHVLVAREVAQALAALDERVAVIEDRLGIRQAESREDEVDR
jgi:hypothetical protein